MRKVLLIVLLFPLLSSAQKDTLSEIDRFYSDSPGSMIKRQQFKIVDEKAFDVNVIKLTNMKSGTSISYTHLDTYGASVLIDMKEINGLIEALEYMSKQSFNDKPENKDSYSYTTPDRVRCELEYIGGISKGWYMTIGEIYYSGSYKPYSKMVFRPSVVDEIIPHLKKAKATTF